jgi:hypothetical protein
LVTISGRHLVRAERSTNGVSRFQSSLDSVHVAFAVVDEENSVLPVV